MQVYAEQNDTLDAVIFRHIGTSNGLLEETLILNPNLANQPVL
ncbi:tail protein X, partial [Pasteurella multocida]